MKLTIVPTYATARQLGATGQPGKAVMPDGSRAVSVRSLRSGAVRGLSATGYVVHPGVELTEDDHAELAVATRWGLNQ